MDQALVKTYRDFSGQFYHFNTSKGAVVSHSQVVKYQQFVLAGRAGLTTLEWDSTDFQIGPLKAAMSSEGIKLLHQFPWKQLPDTLDSLLLDEVVLHMTN